MTSDKPSEGLRDRKKRATRAQLSAIALRHAIERGVAGVRVEDIAAEANVAPRTFNNYFRSKEAAIVGTATIRADRFCEILRSRPGSEPLNDALREAAVALFEQEPDREWIARARLIRGEPSLLAEARKSDIMIEHSIAAEIGRRTDTDPATNLSPRLAAATTVSAIHAAVQFWLDAPKEGALRGMVESAMTMLHINFDE
ncbi:TetR/AcrR family transcriptional regulator [Altericroceibacterium endophyticum]|uniref:TetR family transcriptional regulator n=1 Tax=Altericroceibacterium endophyticum TaxID=1808508 RepID=A0A6I4T6C9_9SPHN|nr:TetR family transcriptional regulator [Altericroceibacterium endophyticum]MXO65355.1 TetR family transcriptional regulator [Altericroceibacterium endophyticum]